MKEEHKHLVWVQYGILLGCLALFGTALYQLLF